MNPRQPPELRDVDPRIKRQTLMVLILGLVMGSLLVFSVVWSGSKEHLEKVAKERAAAGEISTGESSE